VLPSGIRLPGYDADLKLQELILVYRKGPQTPEPSAPCTSAAEMNPLPKDDDK
jgi:hypothetical protein